MTSKDLVFNAALIRATEDPEETVHTPRCTPGVGDDPIRLVAARVNTPSDNLDGMTTSKTTVLVSVDTRAVGEEVLVDGEASLNGAVSHNFLLDSARGRELAGSSFLGLVIGGRRAISTFGWARTGLAIARGVRHALVSDGASVLKVSPCNRDDATVATVVVGVAGDKFLRREDDVGGAAGSNAETVRQNFRSSESPATTTLLLVADRVDAVGPLLARVERIRHSAGRVNFAYSGDLTSRILVHHHGGEETAGFTDSESIKLGVLGGFPAKVALVDVLND